MSYRISTSFPVLSALERQVAHALLTRPPLSQSKQASIFSVRLECVMHAASVHPEPGSNSRFKSSILAFSSLLFLLKKELSSFGCFQVLLSCSLPLRTFFVLPLRCSIFKDLRAPLSLERLSIIPLIILDVKHFFCFFMIFTIFAITLLYNEFYCAYCTYLILL